MPLLDESTESVVFVSAVHDFRMLRRGSIQALAQAAAKLGYAVTFISVRFSFLSMIKGDSRSFLWKKANRPEWVRGVLCFLWFTVVHPFQSKSRFFGLFFKFYYPLHKRLRNGFLDNSFRNADYIIIESGQGILFAERARRLNPRAKIIYRASDKLSTIGASKVLQAELEKNADIFDYVCLLSADMADDFAWTREKVFCVPLGIDADEYRDNGPSPYTSSVNAVSVGSMLFDPTFFYAAASLFPTIQFHIIGCGTTFEALPNVKFYDEMAFKDTLRYIEYASFGIAPYRAIDGADYLATSSLKLKQYEYFGIPAVCPAFAVGQSKNRFGYMPTDKSSIEQAIKSALKSQFITAEKPLDWQGLARRLLDPQSYPDCALPEGGTANADGQSPTTVISLVLCTVGDKERQLTRLFQSLISQNCRAFELILVDQNPPGYLDKILRRECLGLAVKHVTSDRGLSIARNVGILHATGKIIGFPDDDCWYFPDTLDEVTSFFHQNPKVDILLGRTVDALDQPSLSPLRKVSGSVDRNNIWSSGNSNTLFVRRGAIPNAKPFDEQIGVGAPSRYQSGEETDFVLTLMNSGKRAVYIRDLKVGHDQVEEVGTKPILKRAWMYSLGFGYVLKKHNFGLSYVAYRFARSIVGAAWAICRLRLAYGLSRIVWATGTITGYLTARS